MGKRRKCRLWWPSNFSSQFQNPNASCFLFGWFIPDSETSLDVVVAFGCNERKLSSAIDSYSDLQEILEGANKNMHALLQDKCEFSLLGYYEIDSCGNGPLIRLGNTKNNSTNFSRDGQRSDICSVNSGSWSCGCSKPNGVLEQGRLVAPKSMWMKLVYGHSRTTSRRANVIPKLDHIHWNGESISKLDLHVIIYDTPTVSGQHYSLGIQVFSNLGTSYKTPKWFDNLHQKYPLLDLDSIIRAINSANAAQILFGGDSHPGLGLQYRIVCKLTTFTWDLFAVSVASLSTFVYIILQSCHALSGLVYCPGLTITLSNVFSKTCRNIHVRCCQLLYWPLFIQDHIIRYSSCIEFAEKVAFRKHSMWSSVVVDVLFGNILGIVLWYMAESVCLLVSDFALDITNYWLRTGCVWLMGNPAGFKLNTELAGVLGMISLTAIQIWSTLWAYAGFLLIYFTKGLSLCGILFGLTTAAALAIDVISLVTMHILSLHLFLSLLYSTQIQAVAALWRLFRGKKWNPLRNRLDSYDCSVEQHVVGSLLLTPIFLLLPTTSAFYIFFTILHTAVCIMCIAIEVAISFIHATPYAKVLLWLKNKKRFPSGIWFEVASSETETASSGNNTSSEKLHQMDCASSSEPTLLVSYLHSNYLNLGEVVWPHYKCIFSAFSWSSIASSAYGLLSGKSIPCSLGIEIPPKLPWIVIPWREYWRICYDAVYSCKENLRN